MVVDDENYKKLKQGLDFSIPVDGEFRERLINELRTYPNIFLICGDSYTASHTIQYKTKLEMAKAVISICKKNPNVKTFLKECLNHV